MYQRYAPFLELLQLTVPDRRVVASCAVETLCWQTNSYLQCLLNMQRAAGTISIPRPHTSGHRRGMLRHAMGDV